MTILGVVLLIIGLVTGLTWLFWIGLILAVLGLVANLFGGAWGVPASGPRRYYW